MPMWPWPSRRADALGVDGHLAGPVGEALEHSVPPQQAPAGRVLLVDRLPAHLELGGDLLPRPAGGAGAGHLQGLELLEQPPQGAATARSPTRGSLLSTAFASSVASSMVVILG